MPIEESNGYSKREMSKMLFGYMKERVTTLEKREVILIGIIITLAGVLAGVKLGVM